MERNDILAAPQVEGFQALKKIWGAEHTGDFFEFMATPSVERDVFIDSCMSEDGCGADAGVASAIIKV
ncbi:MAG: hypothetical protein NC102_00260 [Clostridium sp.]|nr:hypothetical protein [Clostridium sp.]